MTNPQIAIDIVANDKSAKGTASADKRFKKLGGDVEKVGSRSFGNVARTFAEVEKAASGAFGSKSALGLLGGRVRDIRAVGQALGSGLGRSRIGLGQVETLGARASATLGETALAAGAAEAGMGEAAVAAGGLAVAMGPVAVVGAAAVAVLGAAAIAGYKFASGWAAGTAQIGRLSETIGIASRDLQQLQGAAERYGISKDAANGSVGSFANTVHDAYYARNPAARVLLRKLGVNFTKGADGNLDYNAMLAQVANGLAKQRDPQSALMAANTLGVGGLLPLLRKGSANYRAETADVGQHGAVNSDQDIATAQQFTRAAVQMSQMADRAKQSAQAWTAGKYAPVLDKGVALGRDALDGKLSADVAAIGSNWLPAVRETSVAASKMDRAADKMLQASGWRAGGRFGTKKVGSLAAGAMPLYRRFLAHGDSPEAAAAWAASAMAESGGDPHRKQPGGDGYGLFQWGPSRRADFKKIFGYDMSRASLDDEVKFRDWELTHKESAAGRWINAAQGAAAKGDAVSRRFERPGSIDRDSADRANVAAEIMKNAGPIPVRVEIDLRGAPAGTRAKVVAGSPPAISHAMQH